MIRPAAALPLTVALLGVVALAGCSQPPAQAVAGPTSPPSSTATQPTPTTVAPSPVPTASRTPGWTPPPVIRPSELPAADRIKATPESYTKPVRYTDGLTVSVTAIKQQTVTQVGPGAITGEPMTVFTVRFTNGTSTPVNLNQVVVSAYSGADQASAPPVYEGAMNDFSGTLAPGSSQSAVYAFSIPVRNLGTATLAIDFDGRHTVAVFTGSAR